MKKNIVFITDNEGKRKEVEQILGDKYTIINIDLDVPNIQSIIVEEVTNEKIKYIYNLLKKNFNDVIQKFHEKKNIEVKTLKDVIVICEDTGLYIDNMNDFPGALMNFYLTSIKIDGVIKINGGSLAKAETVIGVIKYGKIMRPISGSRKGKIAKKIILNDPFGWDSIFIPDLIKTKFPEHDGKTYAELKKIDIKNKISQRKNAFDIFKKTILK